MKFMKKGIIIKLNKISIIVFMLVVFLALLSFFQYFHVYYPRERFEYYNKIKATCLSSKGNSSICSAFNNENEVNEYLHNNNPYDDLKKLDAITLTGEILRNTIFIIIQPLSALLIIIAVIGRNHKELKSGMIRNILIRKEYKKYILEKIKSVALISLIMPLILIIIFIISCIITKFNFTPNIEKIKNTYVYFEWKYDNYILYSFIVCLVQYLLSFSYGVIGLISCFKNKSTIVSIIISYISAIILSLFVYIVIGVFILNNIFHIDAAVDLNILGSWYFYENTNYFIVICNAFFIFLSLLSYFLISTKNKERLVLENEKQVV